MSGAVKGRILSIACIVLPVTSGRLHHSQHCSGAEDSRINSQEDTGVSSAVRPETSLSKYGEECFKYLSGRFSCFLLLQLDQLTKVWIINNLLDILIHCR